jgi:hypothetical protein
VSRIWFLLPRWQVAVGICGRSLPVCARWSNLLLFSPGSSCIALPLQLWLVSSSPSKVVQLSFEYSLQSKNSNTVIHHALHFGQVACHPIPLSAFVPHPIYGRLACHLTPVLGASLLLLWLRVWLSCPTLTLQSWFSTIPYPHCQW